jgi:microcompartment protein CcmL/EutN
MLEFFSVAGGIQATDEMLDAAAIEILSASPVCPGKYFVMCTGDVSAVQTALNVGRKLNPDLVTDWVLLPNVEPEVFPALTGTVPVPEVHALGVIETFTGPAAILAADALVKAAACNLIEIRLNKGLGGKAFVLFTGDVSAVEAGTKAALAELEGKSLLVSYAVIPAPNPELIQQLL